MEKHLIKIAIIEDLADVAISVQAIINTQDDMHCPHVYFNAEDALLFIPIHQPQIVIVDIGLPRASGIYVIEHLSVSYPQILFCMFTIFKDDDKIFSSLAAGAKGYILKGATKEKIIRSIREINEGGSPMSPFIARRIIDLFCQIKNQETKAELPITSREMELLTLLAKGLLYKEIGDRLGITIGTVKQHIHKIYEKLHVTNRTEAINMYNAC